MKPFFSLLFAFAGLLFFAGCETSKGENDVPRVFLESRLGNMSDLEEMVVETEIGEIVVPVSKMPILSEVDVARVDLVQVELGKALAFTLRKRGELRLMQASSGNMGGRLVITIGGEPIGIRRIDGPINDGVLFAFVNTPDDELPELVNRINDSLKSL